MSGTDRKTPDPCNQILPGRATEYLARGILQSRGYSVIRSASRDSSFHMMACRDRGDVLFIRIKRTRHAPSTIEEVALRWTAEIGQLRNLIPISDSVQFWVHSRPHGWRFYEVLRGGIAEVREWS